MASDDSRWYTTAPASLRKVLAEIPRLGNPTKVNSAWLSSIGHSGGNAQSMLRVFKNVGLVAPDGTPTEVWPAFKGGDKKALASGIRAGYAPLFDIYPDAQQKDTEALTSFFRSNTGLAQNGQRLCVQTFQTLCSFADFSEARQTPTPRTGSEDGHERRGPQERDTPARPSLAGVGLTVNIQLQLPPSPDGEVYDKLFEAMAKHLRGLIEPR
jgi:Family of unknown function (DUF5343)